MGRLKNNSMRYIRKFKLNEDNSKYQVDSFYIPDGEYSEATIDDLIGKKVLYIAYDLESLTLVCEGKEFPEIYYNFYHSQDCCEDFWLDDIIGDLEDLIGDIILKADEKKNSDDITPTKDKSLDDSWTWTFYTIATRSGYVDLRFIGTSNGYYSEGVQIYKTIPYDQNRIYT